MHELSIVKGNILFLCCRRTDVFVSGRIASRLAVIGPEQVRNSQGWHLRYLLTPTLLLLAAIGALRRS
jgi:hypothetical protein